MFRVKICGITNLDDALLASEQGADAIGFVFWRASPRFVPPAVAAAIVARLSPEVAPVGVFVDETPEVMKQIARAVGLRYVQLHGSESADIAAQCVVPAIKAFGVDRRFNIERLAAYSVAAFLLDARDPQRHGGTGRPIDWGIARTARRFGRIVLSGGLSPDNVRDAIAAAEPDAVDVSSGVEERPGRKSAEKIRSFMAAVCDFQRERQGSAATLEPAVRAHDVTPR